MKGDRLYLHHILEAIEKIENYIAVGRDVFLSTHTGKTLSFDNWKLSARRPNDFPKRSAHNTLMSLGCVSPAYVMS